MNCSLKAALLIALGLALQGAIAQTPSRTDVCEAAREQDWFDADWGCEASGRGLAIAAPAQIGPLAATLDRAVQDFEVYFGPVPHRFAVVGTTILPNEASAFLKEHGYLSLPWVSKLARRDFVRKQVEQQVAQRTAGMGEEQRAAIMAQALAQVGVTGPGDTEPPSDVELGALAHEAGHSLFRAYFDGDITTRRGINTVQYGSSSPDWIDELAAILNENDVVTQRRYNSARERIAAGQDPRPFAFPQYLTMDHPSLGAARALRERMTMQRGSVAIALTGDDAKRFLEESGGDPAQFYLQTRLFADFLLETTGDERIFSAIADGLKDGSSFEMWLAQHSERYGLAGDLTGLGEQWDEWIERRFSGAQ